MTDPQLPPYGSVPPAPPIPPAPGYQPVPPAPAYQTPPGAYDAPVGGYSAPLGGYQAPQTSPPKSAVLGVIALTLSLVAAVVAPILAGVSGYQIGFVLPTVMQYVDESTSDLSFLAPVRDQVLMGEIGFWIGALVGITAIVLGITAIAKRRGRGVGIAALILSVLAPLIFFIVLFIALSVGTSAGAFTHYGS